MALLPYLDDNDASPEVRKMLTSRPVVLNVQRMTANAQGIFAHRNRLSNALFTQIKLDSAPARNRDFAHRQRLSFGL